MSAGTVTGGAMFVIAMAKPKIKGWLDHMQSDMDRVAAGKLPISDGRGGTATAADVRSYLNGRRRSVRA